MYYCVRCVMPSTKPGLKIDVDGVCSVCRYVESKSSIDWEARQKHLLNLCEEIKQRNIDGMYDCIVPVSGGKDSIFQVHVMKNIYKMRVLAVCVTPHLQTFEGISNLNSLHSNLDVDIIKINVKPTTLRNIRKKALIDLGNPNYAEHRVVFAAVARAAATYDVPLVVWGEDIAMEFGGNISEDTLVDGSAANILNNDLFRESSFEALVSDITEPQDLFFYYPDANLNLQQTKSIYLGFYYPWDGRKNFEVAKNYGFMEKRGNALNGNILKYDNIDEKLCEIHIWFKFLKLGFWRPTDSACYLIWNKYMSRDQAIEIIKHKQYQFPDEYLPEFLHYHEMDIKTFNDIQEKWRNNEIWEQDKGQWRLRNEIK